MELILRTIYDPANIYMLQTDYMDMTAELFKLLKELDSYIQIYNLEPIDVGRLKNILSFTAVKYNIHLSLYTIDRKHTELDCF